MMMQRPTSSSRASSSEDHHIVEILIQQQQQPEFTPRRRMMLDHTAEFTCFNHCPSPHRRLLPWYRSPEKLVHVIPLIVLLCCFILWWFSYQVTLEMKDGQITEIKRLETLPETLNKTRFDLAILASANPPNPSVPQILGLINETNAQPISGDG
ncbi:hypothetical protein Ancab_011711 [Ancistrocladus abbreviatus]